MEERKIQLVGKRSYSISLPKEWVLQNKLKEHSKVIVEITKNNDLLVRTREIQENGKAILEINENIPLINLIFLCYYKSINEIILKSNMFSSQQKKDIKKAIGVLEGYTIIEETDQIVKIKGVKEILEYNVEQLIKRKVYLIFTSFQSLKKRDLETIEQNELEINKYFHLSKRILIECVINSSLREKNKIFDTTEIFMLNSIIKKIENIADIIHDMAYINVSEKSIQIIEKYIKLIYEVYNEKKDITILSALVEKNFSLTNRLKSIEGRLNLLCKDIVENYVEIKLNRAYFVNRHNS